MKARVRPSEAALTPMVSATIDTAALKHNLQVIRQRAPRSRVMAVIKANAYGHGLVTVARALASADSLAVARVDEGLTLRKAGIHQRTVLLEGVFDREQLEAAAAAGFELVVHTAAQIELLRAAGAGGSLQGVAQARQRHESPRLQGRGIRRCCRGLERLCPPCKTPVNLFTHLASADTPELPATTDQLARFSEAIRFLPGERSIANSAGMLSFPEAQADWVRPGLLLYGVSPFAGSIGADYGLTPGHDAALAHHCASKTSHRASRWATAATGRLAVPTRLAVAAVGYGDGYPRSLASGSPVLVNEERAPLAGRVSMDMIGIDVTDLQRAAAVGRSGHPVGSRACRWRRSRYGRTPFRTNFSAASASAWR